MEILVHVAAPSSTRDDTRYRAQVAAIRAFEPISRQLLSSDNAKDGASAGAGAALPPPPAAIPGMQKMQSPPQQSAPLCCYGHARAAIAGQDNGACQTSSDSRCDRGLKDLRKKKPAGNPPSPGKADCAQSDPAVHSTATATAVTPIANSNPCPCLRHDLQPILPSPGPGTNQIRPSPLVSEPAPVGETREHEPPIAADSLESVISVIPDSQPELAVCAEQPSHLATRCPALLHEEDQPGRSPKRRRVGPFPVGQTISEAAAVESTITSCSAHHVERALSRDADKSPSALPTQGPHSHALANASSSVPSQVSNPVSAHAKVLETETRPQQQQQQQQPPSSDKDDPSLNHNDTLLSTLPLTLRPPPPPISTSTFTTHITPTLSMLTERLKPARTYKPIHEARELDALERGYWAMRINIARTGPDPAQTQEQCQKETNTKNGPPSVPTPGTGPSSTSTSTTPQPWTETQFTHFWTFLAGFIARDARAGWGVWCIAEHIETETETQTPIHTNTNTTKDQDNYQDPNTAIHTATPTTDDAFIPILLKIYAWGEVAMHIYLMLYLASERRVRGMGLRWVDSWGEVVIQMP
ncbi:uncharacterized protein N7458_003894 [Penicillium daleae]|uniref:Uncharacterized protein n=1 Tax=Penicillium daleae TaxID=63821 RepID=A0AAD6CBS2_9EURO|nr:uncharacterized protein N7458_003894 [Penicillium daleae]KAJ5455630.1 hypothetical protein N7458_003894 [Penicillium daleae]